MAHRERTIVVVCADQALAGCEDRVFVLHHRLGRQASIMLTTRHAAACGAKADAQLVGGTYLNPDQVCVKCARKQVVVVAGWLCNPF